jgi:hypothetical protein
MDANNSKSCRICNESKPLTAYYKQSNGRYRSKCKSCQSVSNGHTSTRRGPKLTELTYTLDITRLQEILNHSRRMSMRGIYNIATSRYRIHFSYPSFLNMIKRGVFTV